MLLQWVTLAIKMGAGHLKEGHNKDGNFGPEMHHIWVQLCTWLPCLSSSWPEGTQPGWLQGTDLLPAVNSSPHQQTHMSSSGRWICHCKTTTSEDLAAWNNLIYWLLHYNVECLDLRQGYKLEDNGFELAVIMYSLENTKIGLTLSIEKLLKGVSDQVLRRWKSKNREQNRNEE